jgi:hypothetical protein
MTQAAYGDKVPLVAAGTAVTTAPWRGGLGMLTVTSLNGTPNFEQQAEDGTWVPVKELGSSAAISAIGAAGTWLFVIPPTNIRMSAGGGTMNVYAIGI